MNAMNVDRVIPLDVEQVISSVAVSAVILAISAKPCQKGEADPRGLRH
jgi:hypothetical protein